MSQKHSVDLLELPCEISPAALDPGSPSQHKHLPALDGVRGIAILLVFFIHYGGGAKSSNPFLHAVGIGVQSGWSGVTLFFILSGFLISGIIWDSQHKRHWVSHFYQRRVLRIFPLYYAALLLVFLSAALAGNGQSCLHHIWRFVLYLQNIPLSQAGNEGFALGSPLVLAHFWSLAVEEQFYLLWPLLLMRAKTLDQARRLSIAIFLLSAAFRIAAWYLLPAAPDANGIPSHRIFHGGYDFTLARGGELAAGAWLAMCYRTPELWQRIKAWAPWICILGFTGYFISSAFAHTLGIECAANFIYGLPSLTIGMGALIVLSLGKGVTNRLFSLKPLRWLGGISYGFYIFHVLLTPLFTWIVAKILPPGASSNTFFGLLFVVAGSLSLLFAWLSFRFFESRFLRLRPDGYGAALTRAVQRASAIGIPTPVKPLRNL